MAEEGHLSRPARFALFLESLEKAPEAASEYEALELVARALNEVEDLHSGVPYDPDKYIDDGRMYPPQKDNRRRVPGRTDLVRYRTKGHNIFIGMSGSIRIEEASGGQRCCLSKAGADGKEMVP